MKKKTKENSEETNEKKLQSKRQNIADTLFRNKLIWGMIFVVLLTAISSPFRYLLLPKYDIDEIARSDISAPFDLDVKDEATTVIKQKEVSETFPAVYNYNANVWEDAVRSLKQFFRQGREGLALLEQSREDGNLTGLSALFPGQVIDFPINEVEYFTNQLELEVDPETLQVFIGARFDQAVEEPIITALDAVLKRNIVLKKDYFVQNNKYGIIKRDILKEDEAEMLNFAAILGLEEARGALEEILGASGLGDAIRKDRDLTLVKTFAGSFISANLRFDEIETSQRRQLAVDNVNPVFYKVKKGKTIVRKGDVVTEKIQAELRALSQGMEKSQRYFVTALGFLIINTFLIFFTWRYTRYYQHHTRAVKNLFVMIGSIYVGMVLLIKSLMVLALLLGESFNTAPFDNPNAWFLAIPFAAGAMIVTLLVDAQMAVVFSVVLSFTVGILGGGDFSLALYALVGNITATYGMHQYRERTGLIKSALMVGGINIIAILALNLVNNRLITVSGLAFEVLCGFIGGFLVSVVAFISLPLLESAFQILTDIRLLELSNQNNTLLQELAVRAPGTYHHSLVVGTLADSAAAAIRANPLFCRVSAFYHDIGKIKKPAYFVENQVGAENKHENLSPNMSSLIIISHVKDGVEIAKTHNLPKSLTDIIPQHHGTRLINYFYHKAREQEKSKNQAIKEEDFRYPGPKPRTKEAAIMMLADAVEAASRTLANPTPARLKGLVKKIFDDIFLDGQLDECDLTLKDLDKISSCFMRILTGIYHQRIDYPNFAFNGTGKAVPPDGSHREKLSEKVPPGQK